MDMWYVSFRSVNDYSRRLGEYPITDTIGLRRVALGIFGDLKHDLGDILDNGGGD